MTQQHIDNDMLSRYIKTSLFSESFMDSAQYHVVLDHLATCEECRNQASVLTLLHKDWQDIQQASSLDENQHQLVCDYLDDLLTTEDEREARLLIENQPDAMRAALHYQSHIEEMETHVSVDERLIAPGTPSPVANPFTWVAQLFNFQSPMVYTMAATAAIFVAVLFLMQVSTLDQRQTMIASYQDNPTLQFTEESKLPGIGFFTQSTNTSIPFNDVNIELLSENSIKISWPEIKGAELYKIRIQVFNQGNKTVLKEQVTEVNHATFQLAPISTEMQSIQSNEDVNKRYEWVLYGNTRDDRMFYASGGFVVATVETDDMNW